MSRWDAALVVFGLLAFAFMVVLVLGLCRAASDADELVQRALERERTTPWTSDHR